MCNDCMLVYKYREWMSMLFVFFLRPQIRVVVEQGYAECCMFGLGLTASYMGLNSD